MQAVFFPVELEKEIKNRTNIFESQIKILRTEFLGTDGNRNIHFAHTFFTLQAEL